jgi:hypothetical protein
MSVVVDLNSCITSFRVLLTFMPPHFGSAYVLLDMVYSLVMNLFEIALYFDLNNGI